MYRTPDNSDIPEWDGVEAEVADLVKTELRESMDNHPAGKGLTQKQWDAEVERELGIAEDAHLDAAYEDRFEPALDAGEWYEVWEDVEHYEE